MVDPLLGDFVHPSHFSSHGVVVMKDVPVIFNAIYLFVDDRPDEDTQLAVHSSSLGCQGIYRGSESLDIVEHCL
jgi:hypothetical protein